jgi:hypothetical protein
MTKSLPLENWFQSLAGKLPARISLMVSIIPFRGIFELPSCVHLAAALRLSMPVPPAAGLLQRPTAAPLHRDHRCNARNAPSHLMMSPQDHNLQNLLLRHQAVTAQHIRGQ